MYCVLNILSCSRMKSIFNKYDNSFIDSEIGDLNELT